MGSKQTVNIDELNVRLAYYKIGCKISVTRVILHFSMCNHHTDSEMRWNIVTLAVCCTSTCTH